MVASQVFEVLSLTIIGSFEDPRLSGIGITHVDMSPDLRLAKVYISSSQEDFDFTVAINVLKKATGKLRNTIAIELNMKRVPELAFFPDYIITEAWKMEKLLSEMNDEVSDD